MVGVDLIFVDFRVFELKFANLGIALFQNRISLIP
jgi:hypothetical protein